jgi:adenylate cyclase
VILGEMGYCATSALTAVVDTVNVASRLETLCKELDLQLVVSQETLRRAGVAAEPGESRAVTIRGRSEPLLVRLIPRIAALPEPDEPDPSPRARRLALWPAR